ncbi:MAG: SDR family NAD(P)-dependent oxidoreductase [Gammaproteobacteria bacterium]
MSRHQGRSTHDFTNCEVLVTGASRGIGLGLAEAFVESNATVTILADDPGTQAVAADLARRFDRPVQGLICDISDARQVADAIDPLARIDVLINNAGLELITPITDPSPEVDENFRRIIDINVLGTYRVTRRALPKIPRGGRIIITASMWGKTAVADFSAYCASKHANIGFMRSMARELASLDINVNAVCPGWVETAASMRSLAAMAGREGRDERELLDEIIGAQALGGLMQPRDITETYLYLASNAARDITGQAITVDRGELMQ